MPRKNIAKYLNPWMFRREKKKARVEELRRTYGDLCWQCGHIMSFHPLAVRRRATVEHLRAKAHGGTSEWANIRLCHFGCNRHLGTHLPKQKVRMRLSLARELVPEFRDRKLDRAVVEGGQPESRSTAFSLPAT